MRVRLGINDCFAVKRWPEPGAWAEIVRDELGLGLVQHTLDLVDLEAPRRLRFAQADAVAAACLKSTIRIHSTFTGLASYSYNLLLHPEPAFRKRAERFFLRAIEFSAAVGACATGGHVGAFSVTDWNDPKRREYLDSALHASLGRLAAAAYSAGLEAFLVENMAARREPSTLQELPALLSPPQRRRVPVMLVLDVGHQCVAGTTGADRDPYEWVRRLGPGAHHLHIQQSDSTGDHHWPFTSAMNRRGRIVAERILETLEQAGAEDVTLMLEVIPSFEQDDPSVLADLKESVEYWRGAITARRAA